MTANGSTEIALRRESLRILSRACLDELVSAWASLDAPPAFEAVRGPEAGLVMARGRIGGGGAPFNLGEVAMTRCVVKAESGEVGFGHVVGRDMRRAELVARFDALLQNRRYAARIRETVLAPIAKRFAADDDLKRSQTAATRVNFFTMVRGEDA